MLTISAFWQHGCHSAEENKFVADHVLFPVWKWEDIWMNECIYGCVDEGINRKSRRLFGCSRWRSSRCRGGEGLRFSSSAFYYNAPWQHREWTCGRMYYLPISTSSAQSRLHSRFSSMSCFHHNQREIETGWGRFAPFGGDGSMCGWVFDVSQRSGTVAALVLMQHLSSDHPRVD